MKKIILWTIFILSAFILFWCWGKEKFEIKFDKFYWYFFTQKQFEEGKSYDNWLLNKILSKDIVKIYKETNITWYSDSIIIMKKETSKDLNDFVQENIQTSQLKEHKEENKKTKHINCRWEKIEMIIIDSELDQSLNNTFFSQWIFKKNWTIYILSYSSQNKNSRNQFSSDITNIKCKQ